VRRSGSFAELLRGIEDALADGDERAAAVLVAENWPRLAPEHGARLRELVESLTPGEWTSDPRMLTAVGASYRALGSPSRSAALPHLQTAETLVAASAAPSVDVVAPLRVQHAAALRSLGRLAEAAELIASAWGLLERDTTLTPAHRAALQARAALQQGMLAIHVGDYELAVNRLRLALGLSDGVLSEPELVECLAGLAFLSYASGDFDGAEELVARARGIDGTAVTSQFGALALIAELLVAVERNQLEDALRLAQRVGVATERTDWEPLALYATAAISIISGRHIEGLDHVHRALQLTRGWDGPAIVRILCEGMRGTLLMHLGELEEAVEVIERLEPTQNHSNCPARFIAGIRFKRGDSAGCLAALQECERIGEDHSSRTMIDVLLLKAAAHYDLGNPVVADIAFDRALLFVTKTRMRTPFTLVPSATMRWMLGRAADRSQPEVVHAILDDLGAGLGGPRQAAEPLSEREMDVAQHLYLDKTLSEIAADLFISTNTVKTHVKSIYRKLDASNRKEAVRRARELGLALEITPR
jgi:DNA-binding CsgD family transcriptional regulator/tetratricopeptide (TPR) repeat protein